MKLLITPAVRTQLIKCAVQVGVCIMVGTALFFAWRYLGRLQQTVDAAELAVQEAPLVEQRAAELARQLNDHRHDVERLQDLFLGRQEIVELIEVMEDDARRRQVIVTVPDIKEEIKLGKDNKPIPATGTYQDIRLTIQAIGKPMDLLAFLYTLEHVPYAARVVDWSIAHQTTRAPVSFSQPAASDTPAAATDTLPGALDATMIVTIKR